MENQSLPNIYISDIDGTLAKHEPHRGPYDEHKVHLDTPLPTCEVIYELFCNGNKIIFFSGRSDKCRKKTIQWLRDNCYPDPFEEDPELYMRKSGDNRSDDVVKEELYNEHIKGKYNVLGVFDDRKKVKRMWVRLGLWVFDCNQTDEEF